jgi:hypothetical protein
VFGNDRAFFLGILRFDVNPPLVQAVQHVISGPEGNEFVAFTLLSMSLYLVEDCLRLLRLRRNRGFRF